MPEVPIWIDMILPNAKNIKAMVILFMIGKILIFGIRKPNLIYQINFVEISRLIKNIFHVKLNIAVLQYCSEQVREKCPYLPRNLTSCHRGTACACLGNLPLNWISLPYHGKTFAVRSDTKSRVSFSLRNALAVWTHTP